MGPLFDETELEDVRSSSQCFDAPRRFMRGKTVADQLDRTHATIDYFARTMSGREAILPRDLAMAYDEWSVTTIPSFLDLKFGAYPDLIFVFGLIGHLALCRAYSYTNDEARVVIACGGEAEIEDGDLEKDVDKALKDIGTYYCDARNQLRSQYAKSVASTDNPDEADSTSAMSDPFIEFAINDDGGVRACLSHLLRKLFSASNTDLTQPPYFRPQNRPVVLAAQADEIPEETLRLLVLQAFGNVNTGTILTWPKKKLERSRKLYRDVKSSAEEQHPGLFSSRF